MDNKGNISGTQAVQNAKKVFDKDSVKKLEDFIGECTKGINHTDIRYNFFVLCSQL